MESLSFIPAIVFFVSLSVYDYLSSRDRHCPRYRTRLMASSGGLILSSCFLLSDAGDAGGFFSALAVSEALMLASPGTGVSPSRTLTYSVAFLGLCLAIAGAAFAFGGFQSLRSSLSMPYLSSCQPSFLWGCSCPSSWTFSETSGN